MAMFCNKNGGIIIWNGKKWVPPPPPPPENDYLI